MGLKATLITGAGVMIVGGVMVFTGLSTGAKTSITWHHGPKIIETHQIKKDLADQDYSKLTINAGENGVVKVVRGKKWQISGQTIDNQLRLKTEQKKLNISLRSMQQVISYNNASQRIVVTVPYQVKLKNLNLKTNGGGIHIKQLSADHVMMTNNYGGIRLRGLTAKNIETKGEGGSYNWQNVTSDTMHVMANEGSFKARQLTLHNSSQLTGEDADVQLRQLQVPGVKVTNQDSSISVNNKDFGETDYTTGDQNNALSINGSGANVDIK